MKIIRPTGTNLQAASWLFILLFVISGVNPLKNVAISIPQAVKIFDTITLHCKYDLEGLPLYTVKWYKGQREFFRYIPNELRNTVVFPVSGLNINLNKSGPNEVVLQEVQPEASGRYLCAVSTDSPYFDTQTASSFMYVVDLPNENPIMEISKNNSDYGYILKANCTTPPSIPAMNVTWYINGIKINEIASKKISVDTINRPLKNRRAPYMTISYMEKEIDDSIHQGEIVKVQCIATLFNLYRSENVRYIDDKRPQPLPSSVIRTPENISWHVCDTVLVLVNGELVAPKQLKYLSDLNGFGFSKLKDSSVVLNNKALQGATIDLVVEEMGRMNGGKYFQYNHTHKGLWQGNVTINNENIYEWSIVPLELKKQWINELQGWENFTSTFAGPAMYNTILHIDEDPKDTFVDIRGWGKGMIFINGFALGRYVALGPQRTLYLPAPFLIKGDNQVTFFEHFYVPEDGFVTYANELVLENVY